MGLVIAAVFEVTTLVGPRQILTAVVALGVSLGAAVFLYTRLGGLYGNYLASVKLFALVERLLEVD